MMKKFTLLCCILWMGLLPLTAAAQTEGFDLSETYTLPNLSVAYSPEWVVIETLEEEDSSAVIFGNDPALEGNFSSNLDENTLLESGQVVILAFAMLQDDMTAKDLVELLAQESETNDDAVQVVGLSKVDTRGIEAYAIEIATVGVQGKVIVFDENGYVVYGAALTALDEYDESTDALLLATIESMKIGKDVEAVLDPALGDPTTPPLSDLELTETFGNEQVSFSYPAGWASSVLEDGEVLAVGSDEQYLESFTDEVPLMPFGQVVVAVVTLEGQLMNIGRGIQDSLEEDGAFDVEDTTGSQAGNFGSFDLSASGATADLHIFGTQDGGDSILMIVVAAPGQYEAFASTAEAMFDSLEVIEE